jgi:hypothetical protein
MKLKLRPVDPATLSSALIASASLLRRRGRPLDLSRALERDAVRPSAAPLLPRSVHAYPTVCNYAIFPFCLVPNPPVDALRLEELQVYRPNRRLILLRDRWPVPVSRRQSGEAEARVPTF